MLAARLLIFCQIELDYQESLPLENFILVLNTEKFKETFFESLIQYHEDSVWREIH